MTKRELPTAYLWLHPHPSLSPRGRGERFGTSAEERTKERGLRQLSASVVSPKYIAYFVSFRGVRPNEVQGGQRGNLDATARQGFLRLPRPSGSQRHVRLAFRSAEWPILLTTSETGP